MDNAVHQNIPAPPVQPLTPVQPPKPVTPPAKVAPSPFVGKTIASLQTERKASMFIVELIFTDQSRYYIKTLQGQVEEGGTADWDTGRKS